MSKLDRLKQRIFGNQTTELTGIFYLVRELKCLPEIIGREYNGYIKIWKWKIHFNFTQRSMNITQLNLLMKELKLHNIREQKEMKKANRGK